MSNISGFDSYMTYRTNAQEMSESKYNLLIGAMLTWGFGLNFLLLKLAGPALLRLVYGAGMLPFLIAYFVLVLVGSSMVRSYDPAKCFIGYNLIAVPVGIIAAAATIGYDPALVIRAVLSTAIVTLSMMIVSTLQPRLFTRLAPAMGFALLAVIIVESLSMLLFRVNLTIIDWVVVGIMCVYIGFDWVRANSVQRTPTNAIAAASALYLDIINIFLRLLRIFARASRDD